MKLSCTTATFGGNLSGKLAAMAAAGFSSTELWPRDLFEHVEGPEHAIQCLDANALTVSAFQALRNFEGAPPAQKPLKRAIASQLLAQMSLVGAQTLVLCANTAPDSSDDPELQAADLRELGDLASAAGKRVAYEPICWGRHIADYRTAWALIQRTDHPAVGLLLDAFHVFARGDSLDGIGAIPGDRIFLVELSDLPSARLDPVELSRNYRLFPGEGIAPVRAFVERVRSTGYDGIYSVEIFNACYAMQPAQDVARRAMQSMRSLID